MLVSFLQIYNDDLFLLRLTLAGTPEYVNRNTWLSCGVQITNGILDSWNILLFLLTIVLYIPLRFTDSDYPFGVFKLILYINDIVLVFFFCLQNYFPSIIILYIFTCDQ
jgi:hypothetical protein